MDANSGGNRRQKKRRGRGGRGGDHKGNPANGQAPGKKFQGLNKDELSGMVVSDTHSAALSHQCDALFDALITHAGRDNPDVKTTLETMKMLDLKQFLPADPDPSEWMRPSKADASKMEEIDCLKEATLKSFASRKTAAVDKHTDCLSDVKKVFSAILGQLSQGIKDDIKSEPEWTQANRDNNTIALPRLLRDRCHRETANKVMPAVDLLRKAVAYVTSKQDNATASTHVESTKIRWEAMKALGATLRSEELIKHTLKTKLKEKNWEYGKDYLNMTVGSSELKLVHDAADQMLLATVIIEGSNPTHHDNVSRTLSLQCGLGHDGCPKTPSDALAALNPYEKKRPPTPAPQRTENRGTNKSNKDQDKTDTDSTEEEKPKQDEKTVLTTDHEDENNKSESEPDKQNSRKKKTPSKTGEAHQLLMDAEERADHNCGSRGWAFLQLTNREPPSAVTRWPSVEAVKWEAEYEFFSEEEMNVHNETSTTVTTRDTDRHKLGERKHIDVSNACAFAQNSQGRINKNWLLLDSQASCNVICNRSLVTNVRRHPDGNTIVIHCNAGSVEIGDVAELKGFGRVWFHPQGIANILSLALASDKYRVALDTHVSQTFHAHKDDGTTRDFHRASCDLCACDLTEETGSVFAITTIEGQEKQCSKLDVKRARRARKLQDSMMFPSIGEFLKMIDRNQILNCPVTRRDIILAEEILGVNPNVVKGKTVRQQPGHVREDTTPVPHNILTNCGNVTIPMDMFYVNGIRFFRTASRHLMFRMTRCMRDASESAIIACLKAAKGFCGQRGFAVVRACGDNEFQPCADDMSTEPQTTFDPVARGQHEPFIERDNRTSEERIRCTFAAIPFKRIPIRMVIELVLSVDFWLNCWCSSGGVSRITPPREILTGIKLDANLHCKLQFGDCALAHGDSDNGMKERASDSMHLRTTGSANGGFYVFDLNTARRVHRRTATLACTTQTVVDRVHAIAITQDAPIGLQFADMHKTSTILDINASEEGDDDDASDASYECPETESLETDFTDAVTEDEFSDDEDETNDPQEVGVRRLHETNQCDEGENDPGQDDETVEDDDVASTNDIEMEREAEHEIVFEHDTASVADGTDEQEPHEVAIQHPEQQTEPIANADERPARVRRKTHPKFYDMPGEGTHSTFFTAGFIHAVKHLEIESHKFMLVAQAVDQHHSSEASQITPQYGVRKGLEIFGEAGTEAVLKELKQLHDRKVITPVNPKDMTREEVKRALECLMFLKRKRSGLVKGRGCADGRPQREFTSREEASSPTVNAHAFFLTAPIDAIEGRAVATADTPGAFLQTNLPKDETVHLRIAGAMAKLLHELDPDLCGPCLKKTKRGWVICAKANKAIYGALRAALLFWQDLSGKLESWGFIPNDCDQCTVDKMINGSQCTIVWHVDDLKTSHKSEEVITEILDKLNKECGKVTPLTVERGRAHECLGMTIDCSNEGVVRTSMDDHLQDIIATLPEELKANRVFATPAADHLFEVNNNAERLSADKAAMFHHCVAKLPFASKRSRPDPQTAVAFLCTRVKGPDVDDWKKLMRVLGYPKETMFLALILGDDGTGNTHWHVDASFAVHNDMRSHTGAIMTCGRGAAISMSVKQKLNTKSSTEAELVGVDDALPHNIWCKNFLVHQGCHANGSGKANQPGGLKFLGDTNILYQDNTSSIQLERNGKASSTKRTRAISIRCFLIADKVKRGETSSIEHCPTKEMLADYFAKPLQGALFRRFRNAILGISDAECISMKMNCENKNRVAK